MKIHILALITFVTLNAYAQKAGVEQSLRFYTKGSLLNASILPAEGPGFIKVFKPKNRTYGSMELVEIIQTVAHEIALQYPKRDRLQVGDIANLKGGSIGKHKSHQNGLDADIVYYRKNNNEQDPNWMGRYVEKFVSKGKVTSNFDTDRNWLLLSKLTSFPQVRRIFVDIAIKKNFCNLYSKNPDPQVQETLRALRPAALHDDHMHVRLDCSVNSKRCTNQPAPAPGNGCSPMQMQWDLLNHEEALGC